VRLIPENPATPVPLAAKPKHQSEGTTPEQVAAFVAAAAGDRLYAMYLLAIDGGLRQGELFGLTWKDVDLDRGTVRVNKSLEEVKGELKLKAPKTAASIRTVKLSATTTAALGEHRKASWRRDTARPRRRSSAGRGGGSGCGSPTCSGTRSPRSWRRRG
jgi:integrase